MCEAISDASLMGEGAAIVSGTEAHITTLTDFSDATYFIRLEGAVGQEVEDFRDLIDTYQHTGGTIITNRFVYVRTLDRPLDSNIASLDRTDYMPEESVVVQNPPATPAPVSEDIGLFAEGSNPFAETAREDTVNESVSSPSRFDVLLAEYDRYGG
jgi:hypothetical protein